MRKVKEAKTARGKAAAGASYEFKVVFEPDPEGGGYVACCPSLPGCYSEGETIEEAMANIREAILLCVEEMKARGEAIPDCSGTLVGSVLVAA